MERKADRRPENTREILQTLTRIKLDFYPPPLPPVVQPVPPTVPSRLPTVPSVPSRPSRASRRNFITIASFTAIGAVATAFGRQKMQGILSTSRKVSMDSQPVSFEPIPEPETKYNLLSRFEFQAITVNDIGQEIDRQRHSAEFFIEDLGNGIILEMVSIPGGTFMMGSPDSEKDSDSDEKPQHRLRVPGFFMGKYQVTQAQWQAVMGNNPSYFKGEDLPVELITWYNAEKFCKELSQKTGRAYRLPSEAEWEYACRAGTTRPFHFGATITTDLANYNGNYTYEREPRGKYREQTTPVGSFPANAFGLYDMHGNVWEWCQDAWHDNYQGAPTDGTARVANKQSGDLRILRGGSWFSLPGHCRGACRNDNGPIFRRWDSGFRVVLSSARGF
ncbi:MAG: formylglycine-generating enzyme family protein [Oscillatoria sp. SIO1A7]|nr:formylglycine-generating enzyme family protein [Oscillatoria sp. SIO1A7]